MGAALRAMEATEPRPSRPPSAALRDLLDELMTVLLALPVEVYTGEPSAASGSIGGHVRHVLDHVAALVAASPRLEMSYDHRTRGTAIEHDPAAAVREILRLQAGLVRWASMLLDEPVAVTSLLSTRGDAVTGWSTRGRELAFVVSHTIHHQAMIGMLMDLQGAETGDARFGYSPSTPRT
jgi:uncharacterized damage-inducible protein DinB